MAYDGRAVANFVLDRCELSGRKVSNLPLQKIVYFCHVWSLIDLSRPLVKQKFEAWEYGPVLPYLYRDFRNFERTPIFGRAMRLDPLTGHSVVVPYDFPGDTAELLQAVVAFYSRMRPGDLVELSHVSGGPWHEVWFHIGASNPGMRIEDDRIAAFYSTIKSPFIRQ